MASLTAALDCRRLRLLDAASDASTAAAHSTAAPPIATLLATAATARPAEVTVSLPRRALLRVSSAPPASAPGDNGGGVGRAIVAASAADGPGAWESARGALLHDLVVSGYALGADAAADVAAEVADVLGAAAAAGALSLEWVEAAPAAAAAAPAETAAAAAARAAAWRLAAAVAAVAVLVAVLWPEVRSALWPP